MTEPLLEAFSANKLAGGVAVKKIVFNKTGNALGANFIPPRLEKAMNSLSLQNEGDVGSDSEELEAQKKVEISSNE